MSVRLQKKIGNQKCLLLFLKNFYDNPA